MLKHIVMWKFKEGTEEQAKDFAEKLVSLKEEIPEIVEIEVGFSDKPNNSYDAVLISEFRNKEDLEAYKTNPKHKKVSELCKSIRTDRISIDYEK